MDNLSKENLHHAYLVIGDRENSVKNVKRFLSDELSFSVLGNADFFEKDFENFSIEDVRALSFWASQKAFGEKKIALLSFRTINSESQNALLKLLEEPPFGVQFFFVANTASIFLPTLLSRFFVIDDGGGAGDLSGKKFLEASFSERLQIIEKIAKKETKKEDLFKLINSIEEVLAKDERIYKYDGVEAIFTVKKYLFDRSPSIKMIGEYLALALPTAGKN